MKLTCINNCEKCKWIEFRDEYPFCILTQKRVALFFTCFMFSSKESNNDFSFTKDTSNTISLVYNKNPNFNSKE